MINVNVKDEELKLHITVKGHAGYQVYNKDIVCASVSTALIMTLNLIEKLNLGYNVLESKIDEGYFSLLVNKGNEVLDAISFNLDFTLESLSKQYPKYIKYNR